MNPFNKLTGACAVMLAMSTLLATGCESSNSNRTRSNADSRTAETQETAPPRRGPRTTGARYSYSPSVGADMGVVGLPFPTGDEATSALLLHQVMPMEARVGSDFPVEFHVTNVTNGTLQNVALLLESQSNLMVNEASPEPQTGADGLVWSMGDLGPRETEIVYLNASARETGQSGACVSVSYNNSLCMTMNIVNPELTIAKRVTPQVLLCDPISITYTVCNEGSGVAEDVTVMDTLPRGLTVNGSSTVNMPVGDLMGGECRDVTVTAMASRTGEFCSPATAESGDGLSANSGEPCTVVVQPVLTVECDSRESQFYNRASRFSFTITNDGDGVCNNTTFTANMSAGASLVANSSGGTAGAGNVTWNLGALQPGDSRTVTVDATSSAAGEVAVTGTANCVCAESASSRCTTKFEGIPAILLEVVDLVDPVEVGTTSTYRIIVTNQGSAPDNDIVIEATLPTEMEFVGATGATEFRRDGRNIRFVALPTLAPGAQAIWEITIRAIDEGDVRFELEMTSREKTRPIRETESTTLYN